MTISQDVVLVDIIGAVIDKMIVPGISSVNYEAGQTVQIVKSLLESDTSITQKSKKYPLIAMFLPVRENRGLGYYSTAKIDRIVIATLTKSGDGEQSVSKRYDPSNTFKTILYPCYYEFLNRLAQSPNVIGGDPDNFTHTKMDFPGDQPVGQGLNDYIDSIDILNLELTLSQFKSCKSWQL